MEKSMKFIDMPIINKGITHGGVFHADDVFSTALLQLFNPNLEIERVMKVEETIDVNATTGTIVYDIGDGRFDHHHGELKYREDGCPKAAFGLLWEQFGPYLTDFDESAWKIIDDDLVRAIDAHDNGFEMNNPLSLAIGAFNPCWDENSAPLDRMMQFKKAVDAARTILARWLVRANSSAKAKNLVRSYVEASEHKILILDQFLPWKDYTTDDEIHFAVYPSERGGWCIQSIDSEKYPLPKEWLDNMPKGITFVHKNLFLAAVETKEQAIRYAEYAVSVI